MEPVEYTVREDHLLAFYRLVSRKAFVICSTLFGGYAAFLVVLILMGEGSGVIWGLLIGTLLLIGLIVVARYILTPRHVRVIYREDKQIQQTTTLTYDPDGFTTEFASGRNRREWMNMVKWEENDAIFVIFSTRQLGHILPKDQVPENVIGDLRNHLGASGLLKQGKLRK